MWETGDEGPRPFVVVFNWPQLSCIFESSLSWVGWDTESLPFSYPMVSRLPPQNLRFFFLEYLPLKLEIPGHDGMSPTTEIPHVTRPRLSRFPVFVFVFPFVLLSSRQFYYLLRLLLFFVLRRFWKGRRSQGKGEITRTTVLTSPSSTVSSLYQMFQIQNRSP